MKWLKGALEIDLHVNIFLPFIIIIIILLLFYLRFILLLLMFTLFKLPHFYYVFVFLREKISNNYCQIDIDDMTNKINILEYN